MRRLPNAGLIYAIRSKRSTARKRTARRSGRSFRLDGRSAGAVPHFFGVAALATFDAADDPPAFTANTR